MDKGQLPFPTSNDLEKGEGEGSTRSNSPGTFPSIVPARVLVNKFISFSEVGVQISVPSSVNTRK